MPGHGDTAAQDSRQTSQTSAGAADELARDVASLEQLLSGMRLESAPRTASADLPVPALWAVPSVSRA